MLCLFNQQSITYNFTIIHTNKSSSLFEGLLYRTFLSDEQLCIGTPYQCETVIFDPASSLTLVLNKQSRSSNQSDAHFRKSLSYSYKRCSDETIFTAQKMISGELFKDRIKFGPLEMDHGSLYLGESWNSDLHYSTIGLSTNIYDTDYLYFIVGLSRAKLIIKPQYHFEFDDDNKDKGRIIFGSPINNNDKRYTKLFKLKTNWYFITNYFTVKNILLHGEEESIINEKGFEVSFDESFNFILMPHHMKKIIYSYTRLNEEICETKIYQPVKRREKNVEYHYILCSKTAILTGEYYLNELRFAFNDNDRMSMMKEDWFREYDEKSMILSIVFGLNCKDPAWTIGYPILKNYALNKNFNGNVFTVYLKKTSNNNSKIHYALIILSIHLSFALCYIGFILCKLSINKL